MSSSSPRADVLKVVDTARTANGGAALGDADVLMLLMHVLRSVGRGASPSLLSLVSLARGTCALTAGYSPCAQATTRSGFSPRRSSSTRTTRTCRARRSCSSSGPTTAKARSRCVPLALSLSPSPSPPQNLIASLPFSVQQTALRMSKRFPDERYLWWSLLSTVLAVRDLANPNPDAPLLVSIAERQLSTRYAASSASEGYKTADEFHLVTRVLELSTQYGAKAALPASTTSSSSSAPLVLPSLPRPTDASSSSTDAPSPAPSSPAATLLAHFSSSEADRWCATNLGLELWRREATLTYGMAGAGGTWEREVGRLKGALEKGCVRRSLRRWVSLWQGQS